MDFFITNAWAQDAAPAGGGMGLIIWTLLFIALMYFLMIRPQMKRAKEHSQMVGSLAKGDEIVTTGGVAGRIREIGDNFIALEVADKLEIKVQKHAVSTVLPKGSLKEL
ncbi:MAG: preprotein translocase subunit YajC [Gammaproteobacteria bacterium]